jgi:hypothetical protein
MKDMNADWNDAFLLLVRRVVKRQIIDRIGLYIGCLGNDFGVRPQTHWIRADIRIRISRQPPSSSTASSVSTPPPSHPRLPEAAEIFVVWPAPTDHHVQDTLVLLLVALERRHVGLIFEAAKREMGWYRLCTDFATAGSANGDEAMVNEPAVGMKGDKMAGRQGLSSSYLHRPLLEGRTILSLRTLKGGSLRHTTDA